MPLLYPELFRSMERARWSLASVPWSRFDPAALTDEHALTVRMNAITEWSALPATEMFLRDNRDDDDFSAFMSIWFYEEQKHALALMEYLRRFRPALVPTEEELHRVRLRSLSSLLGETFDTVRDLGRYRRAVARGAPPAEAPHASP